MDIDQLAKRQLRDAYELQMAEVRLRVQRGEQVAGYKVGCVSSVMQAQLGLDHPVFGHVFEGECHKSGVVLNPHDFDGLAIEGEFAVRIARDIPDADWLRGHPDEAISSGFAVVELHNYMVRNTPYNAQELIENNAIHAGVVLPLAEPPMSRPSELTDAVIRVSINGTTLGTANGRTLPAGPFASVVRLSEHLASFGLLLRRGQIVLTGSPLPLYRVADGDRIEVSCDRSESVVALVSS